MRTGSRDGVDNGASRIGHQPRGTSVLGQQFAQTPEGVLELGLQDAVREEGLRRNRGAHAPQEHLERPADPSLRERLRQQAHRGAG